jgi:glutaredoxin
MLISLWCFTSAEVAGKELSTQKLAMLLQPIEHHAMQYGEGTIKVYVFVDPKCPHSQDFISMLFESPKMRSIYRYYIFFYELKRFKSHGLIETIYAAPSPLQRMLEVMVGKNKIDTVREVDPRIEEKIEEIEQIAAQVGVSKRPYLIIAKERD